MGNGESSLRAGNEDVIDCKIERNLTPLSQVLWDHNSATNGYRIGDDDKYDLKV